MADFRTYTVVVTQTVLVRLDAAKFDEEFMSSFRKSMYPFADIDRHAEHLAQMEARGVYEINYADCVEGYGAPKDMGISVTAQDCDTEVVAVEPSS